MGDEYLGPKEKLSESWNKFANTIFFSALLVFFLMWLSQQFGFIIIDVCFWESDTRPKNESFMDDFMDLWIGSIIFIVVPFALISVIVSVVLTALEKD